MSLPIIFIPGLLCNHQLWRGVIGHLSHKTQVVDITQYDNVAAMTQAIAQNWTKPSVVCGFSLGGWVALNLFDFLPNKQIAGLILVSTTWPDALSKTTLRAMQQAMGMIQHGLFADYVQQSLAWYVTAQHQQNQAIIHTLSTMMHTIARQLLCAS